MRIGLSCDIHQFAQNRKLVLAGVEIEYEKGLLGHSDADVLTHAIAEAILGALSLGDLGSFFPDSDPKYKDISSLILLAEVYRMMDEQGYQIGNIDSLVMIEEPKLAKYKTVMQKNIADVLHCNLNQVCIKATRGERLGFVGRKEGVMAQAVVLLEEKETIHYAKL